MKVYFTASTYFNGQFKENYKKIIYYLKKHHLLIISGEQIINQKLLELDKKIPPEKIFKRQKKLIDESDFIVAEVTYPSHGVGGEIVYALINDKPVLGLVYENNQDLISPMILGNPSENFYLERYDFGKLPYLIKDFIDFLKTRKKIKGKLIVIEGSDGSGKTVQSEMLINYLKNNKYNVRYFDFPQYYKTFHGRTVAKFLRGEFGKIDEVSPYLASLAYALDRVSVKKEMEDFLKKGGIIVCNRYATSNLAHQGAKFEDNKKKEEFLKWLYELEYKIHKIPKEDIVIYLYVPWKISVNLTKKKKIRDYLEGKEDIAESDVNHQIASEKMYLELVSANKNWIKINCVDDKGNLMSKELIHRKIIDILKNKNLIK